MPKNLIPAFAFVIVILSACTKSQKTTPDPSKTGKIKIEIVSGNNQSDTIGNYLKDSIVIRLTKNNQPLKNYKVQFTGSGCDSYLMQERTSNDQGVVEYSWQLSAETGKQSLKTVVFDDSGKRIDSTSTNAIGVKPTHGFAYAACVPALPLGPIIKLSSGRLLIMTSESIIYSDDNAISWHKMADHQFFQIFYLSATPQDELFLCASNNLYYSKDQGRSWELRSPVKDLGLIELTIFTKNNLLYACYGPAAISASVYVSKDKGLHWDPVENAPHSIFQDASEQKNGDVFFKEQGGRLFNATDNGTKWELVFPTSRDRIWGMASDNSGNIYIAQAVGEKSQQHILKSTDGGKTYHEIVLNNGIYYLMTKQSDGNLYAWNVPLGFYKLDVNTNALTEVTPPGARCSGMYILAKNNSFVFLRYNGNNHNGLMYTLP